MIHSFEGGACPTLSGARPKGGNILRDIRDDLHERANILAGQITLAQGQVDKLPT